MQRIDIHEASRRTGLSVSALRRGCKAGRFAHIRVGSARGKIMFDPAVLQLQLRNEELASTYAAEIAETADTWDESAEASGEKSVLADLFEGNGEAYEE